MSRTLLKRSKRGLYAQVIITGILSLILALLSSFVLSKLLGWAANEGQTIKTLAWIVIIGGWCVTSIKLWGDWKVKKYEITEDAFVVYGRAGSWGSSQAIYRYESIISINMTQGFWGKKYNYGDVRITIPKLDKDIIMNDIEDPVTQLANVQQRINERSGNKDNLIT